MKKISKYIVSVLLVICVFGTISTVNEYSFTAKAADTLLPKPIEDFHKDGPINSYLVTANNGYMRVYYDENSNKVGIEYYDSNFNITSTKSIAMELSMWGGFYKGKDAYYLIEGQDNENEVYGAEYMRVIKYDYNWNKTGTAKVTTALPDKNSAFIVGEPPSNSTSGVFRSNVSVEEYNNTLYIATGRLGYRDSKGIRHQGLLLVAVDESTMECHIVDENLYHSNDQYLVNDGSDIYMIDSRTDKYLYLSVYDSNMYSGDTYSDRSERTKSKGSILDYKISYSYNTPSGIELSDNNVLTLFESADLEAPNVDYAGEHFSNVYLAVTPKSNMTKETTTIKKLSDYTKPVYFASLHLTKINSNRYLVMWGETSTTIPKATDSNDTLSGYTLHYIFVDGNGNSLTQEYTVNARVSECPPILNGSKVVFSSSSDDAINFYTIDANSGAFSKKVYNKSANNDTPSSSSTTTSSSSSSIKPQSSSTVSSSSVKPQSSSSSKSSSKPSSSSVKPQSSSSASSSVPASSSIPSGSSTPESSTTIASSSSSAEDTPTSSASSSVSTSSSSISTSSVPAESNGSSGNNSSSSSASSTVNAENTSDNGLWIIIAVAGGAVVAIGAVIAVVAAKKKK